MFLSSRPLFTGLKAVFQAKSAAHPAFRPDRFDPVGKGWNKAEVFADMLLAYPSDWDHAATGERDCGAENRFRHEDALGVVPQGAVAEVGGDLLRLVKPVVDALVVGDRAAPFPHAGQRVMVRMRHDRLPQNVWVLVEASMKRWLNSSLMLRSATSRRNSP